MEHDIKDNGKTIEHMDTDNLCMLMVMFMKETGLMTKLMVLEYIFMLMVPDMKEIGKTIYNMEEERKLGQMDLFMKEIINKEKSMALEYIVGVMDQDTRENGRKIRLRVMEHILG
jgi:hypothetical protein